MSDETCEKCQGNYDGCFDCQKPDAPTVEKCGKCKRESCEPSIRNPSTGLHKEDCVGLYSLRFCHGCPPQDGDTEGNRADVREFQCGNKAHGDTSCPLCRPTEPVGDWEKEFDETMIEDWLDADAHSNRLPVKFDFSDLQLIGELLNPSLKNFIRTLLREERTRTLKEVIEAVEKLDHCVDVENDEPSGCSESHWLFSKEMKKVQQEAVNAIRGLMKK